MTIRSSSATTFGAAILSVVIGACGAPPAEVTNTQDAITYAKNQTFTVTDINGRPMTIHSVVLDVSLDRSVWQVGVQGRPYLVVAERRGHERQLTVTSGDGGEHLSIRLTDTELLIDAISAGLELGTGYERSLVPPGTNEALTLEELGALGLYFDTYLPNATPEALTLAFVGFPTVIDSLPGDGQPETSAVGFLKWLGKVIRAIGKLLGGLLDGDGFCFLSHASCVDSNGSRSRATCSGCLRAVCKTQPVQGGGWRCDCGCQ